MRSDEIDLLPLHIRPIQMGKHSRLDIAVKEQHVVNPLQQGFI